MELAVRGLAENLSRVRAMRDRLRDMTTVLTVHGEGLRTLVDGSFRNQGTPWGEPWEPLAPATLARRRGTTATILVDTGRLRQSIVVRAGATTLTIGAAAIYAATHQFGTWAVPARAFLPVESDGTFSHRGTAGAVLERLKAAVARYIATGEVLA